MLMVKPNMPHAIAHGEGLIEHFGFRAPSPGDRQSLGPLPTHMPSFTDDEPRELRREWGYRIPLHDSRNHNCWLVGLGTARFQSPHFLFAYLDFPTHEAANAGLGTRHRLHLHRESWEYYAVLSGTKTLQIEDEEVTLRSGEMLEVNPGVKHTLSHRQAPYRGFTFRVPLRNDKEEY
jgi:mannose-6-phosphate isomerase-like protein (cupin superfamily)